jgi:hypothetical protein
MNDLQALGLSQGLIDHLAANDPRGPFGYRCQPARYWKSSPLAARGVVPLWECGTVLNYFDPATQRYEQCSLEMPGEAWHSFSSLQGALAVLFIAGYEDDLDDGTLRAYAEKFGFRHMERLLGEMPESVEDYERWRHAFPGECM